MIFGFLHAFVLFLLKVPMILLGLPVVWFALPYAKPEGDVTPFRNYPGNWQLVRLPRWALWWDNIFDGALGDKRGWWATIECKGVPDTRVNMWRWMALRNPAGYFSRVICGVDVSTLTIEQVGGNIQDEGSAPYRGWYLLKGVNSSGRVYPRFYAEFAFWKTYGLMIDIGWKIKLSHNGRSPDAPMVDRLKGIVFVISPAKELS